MSKFGNNISNRNFNPKGPVIHFLTGRGGEGGAGGIWVGGMPKNMALKGGPGKNYWVSRGGHQEILSSFAVKVSVITDW